MKDQHRLVPGSKVYGDTARASECQRSHRKRKHLFRSTRKHGEQFQPWTRQSEICQFRRDEKRRKREQDVHRRRNVGSSGAWGELERWKFAPINWLTGSNICRTGQRGQSGDNRERWRAVNESASSVLLKIWTKCYTFWTNIDNQIISREQLQLFFLYFEIRPQPKIWVSSRPRCHLNLLGPIFWKKCQFWKLVSSYRLQWR